jgi:hypothetical protein
MTIWYKTNIASSVIPPINAAYHKVSWNELSDIAPFSIAQMNIQLLIHLNIPLGAKITQPNIDLVKDKLTYKIGRYLFICANIAQHQLCHI